MRTTVKRLWTAMLLILLCSVSCKALDFAKVSGTVARTSGVSASLSSCSSSSNVIKQSTSDFANLKFSRITDVELGAKPVTEIYYSNQQRLRRIIEDNLFLRNIFLLLSHHQNLLAHGRSKQFYSDKDPDYALTGSDYYIFTLRRILI